MGSTSLLLLVGVAAADSQLDRFLSTADVASFLGLHPRTPLTLPTEVNVLFIGFAGEGDAALNVSDAVLAPWFQQLRDIVPHAVLPRPRTNPDGASESPALAHRKPAVLASDASAPAPAVQYSTRLRVHRLAPEVTQRIEDLIAGHLRPEHVGEGGAVGPIDHLSLQLSAHVMSAFLASLVRALRLPGFSLLVLNPRRPAGARRYGYRAGFSSEEVAALRSSEDAARLMQAAATVLDAMHAAHAPKLAESFLQHGITGKAPKPGAKGSRASGGGGGGSSSRGGGSKAGGAAAAAELDERAAEWAAGEAAELLGKLGRSDARSFESRGTPEALLARVSATVMGASEPARVSQPDDRQAAAAATSAAAASAATTAASAAAAAAPAGAGSRAAAVATGSGSEAAVVAAAAAAALHRLQLLEVEEAMRTGDAAVGCLTDVWLAASSPLAFIDLTAGPFQWGPIGGVGLRTLTTLPDLHTDIDTPRPLEAPRVDVGADGAPASDGAAPADGAAGERHAERELLRELMQRACDRAEKLTANADNAGAGAGRAGADGGAGAAPSTASVADEQAECAALTSRLATLDAHLEQLSADARADTALSAPLSAPAGAEAVASRSRAALAAAAISSKAGEHAAWHGPRDYAVAASARPGGAGDAGEADAQGGAWVPGDAADAHLAPAWLEERLARLGAAASALQAHVLLPPSAEPLSPQRARPYAERVSFHVYVVSSHSKAYARPPLAPPPPLPCFPTPPSPRPLPHGPFPTAPCPRPLAHARKST